MAARTAAQRRETRATIRRRLTGVVFLAVLAGLLTLSIAFYNKAFTKTVQVTLRTDSTGNQLRKASDVKERGIIVGSVKKVASEGDGAIVTLALQPSRVDLIPSNVSAQVLPKTLFGEQYVALQIPARKARAIKGGDVIEQDRSASALETQKVLGDLLPLLQAVKPAELNATLTAVANALQGRGEALGNTLVSLDSYLKHLNADSGNGQTYTQQLVDDLKKVGQVADLYNGVAPTIMSTLDDLQTSVNTVTDKRQQLDTLLGTISDTSGVIRGFLSENEQNLIRVTGDTDKIAALLAEYAPSFQCIFEGMNDVDTLASNMFQNHAVQLSIVLDNTSMGKYKPGQQPTLIRGYGPHCFGLPDNVTPKKNGHFEVPDDFKCLNDGAPLTDECSSVKKNSASKSSSTSSSATNTSAEQSLGSPAENALVNALLTGTYGSPDKVPDIARTLAAPLLRGAEVDVK